MFLAVAVGAGGEAPMDLGRGGGPCRWPGSCLFSRLGSWSHWVPLGAASMDSWHIGPRRGKSLLQAQPWSSLLATFRPSRRWIIAARRFTFSLEQQTEDKPRCQTRRGTSA